MAWLSHNLTVAVRSLTLESKPAERRLEQLYAVNEIQHRVSSYIGHALGTDEDTGWLVVVAAHVFEAADADVRREAVFAWDLTRKNFASSN